MSVTHVDFLEDRVKIDYHLGKPWGISDVDDSIEIPYNTFHQLPRVKRNDNLEDKRIFVPACGKTLVLMFYSYQERNGGPLEEDFKGVFLEE